MLRVDLSGALSIGGRSLGVPWMAVVAAIQVAQACRAVSDGGFFDLTDVTLVNCSCATGCWHALARPGNPAFPAGQEQIRIASPMTEMHRYITANRGRECVAEEGCVPRSDVFVQSAGGPNSAGSRPAGTEAKTETEPEECEKV
ncbi:hypothetical protein CK489_08160 [Bradyrhizobium sp. UFLA03-84]|uniref:hypothetical protein n=1 Tax=Bradyrhizobium sp. UFLA03-84 TaxID=418599 RepID=UPI000BAE17BB|nr:hypothetical protein [Bradyrhizobium sp. UFLA03-84]PAY10483.1 hypothetical protein CK489_08160 [Bradyrhizobium sp. UFLA03-84]